MKYTPEQQAFINEIDTTYNSIRLDAVAGSGKTTTLLAAAELLNPAETTIALAFNKKIQETLRERFPAFIECRTFNGLGHGIWTRSRGRMKLDSRKMGSITSDVCKERGLGDNWHEILALSAQMKKSGFIHPDLWDKQPAIEGQPIDSHSLADLAAHHDIDITLDGAEAALEVLFRSCIEARHKRMDFDDQIYMSTYFSSDKFWTKYDNILVDEAQDLSEMQHDMLERMSHSQTRIIAVGDPNQAIYGWRGASADSMNIMSTRFNLKHMPLSVCFRCPPEIVSIAKNIVPQIQPFEGKEGGTVASLDTKWQPHDIELGSVVLCRNNAPLVALAFDLLTENIPAYFSGRNLAKGLKKVVDELDDGPLGAALVRWRDDKVEMAKANQKYDKADQYEDTFETLKCIQEGSQSADKRTLKSNIDYLFRKEYAEDAIELSTIHRSKGKEWDHVYFLNQHLIPGRWVQQAFDEGKVAGQWMMQQEHNLRYVAVTRSLSKLTYIVKQRAHND